MTQTISVQKRPRICLMDEIRGFAVLCMIFYHGFYTLANLFGIGWGMALLRFFMPAEPFFAGAFIFISGISSDLSRSNLKRGGKLFLIALAVSAVTYLAVPQEVIVFGILHFLSICMMVYGLCKPLLDRFSFSWIPIAVCAVLYACTMDIQKGIVFFAVQLPQTLYETSFLFPFGMPGPEFRSSDYFPLLPWIFVFFAGGFFGKLAAAGKFPAFTYRSRVPFLSWMGRHALLLYIVHQPVIFGAAWLCELLFTH